MPVKLTSRSDAPATEARIEIIPLIDIMFFLLAAFMLVSLSMVNLKRVNLDLPAVSSAEQAFQSTQVNLCVDKSGVIYLDTNPVGARELDALLKARKAAGEKMRVLISGDKNARHGDIVHVLDIVRAAGVYHVGVEVAGGNSDVIKK